MPILQYERTVKGIEYIASLLTAPPKIIPLFQKQVTTLPSTESAAEAVKIMRNHEYSQIPIQDSVHFNGLLTANTIARWLGACVDEDVFSLKDTLISQVLNYTEDKDNYVFLRRNDDIFIALEYFESYEKKGKRLEALLITDTGKSLETIIGIITVSDLPKAFKETGKYSP